jgi:hypothetical protein
MFLFNHKAGYADTTFPFINFTSPLPQQWYQLLAVFPGVVEEVKLSCHPRQPSHLIPEEVQSAVDGAARHLTQPT